MLFRSNPNFVLQPSTKKELETLKEEATRKRLIAELNNPVNKKPYTYNNETFWATSLKPKDFYPEGVSNPTFNDLEVTPQMIDYYKADPKNLGKKTFGKVPNSNVYSFGDLQINYDLPSGKGIIPSWEFDPGTPSLLLHPNISPQKVKEYMQKSQTCDD